MYINAIIVPGFSEFERCAEPLAEALTSGPYALAGSAEIVCLSDALDNPERYEKAFKGNLVVTHSAGLLAVNRALEVIALNPPEPTTLRKTIKGANAVNSSKNEGIEEGIVVGGIFEVAKELGRHPVISAKIPLAIRTFSSAQHLVDRAASFVNGRSLFYTDQDQFGFTRPEVVDYANQNGIFARILQGEHNHAMFQPKDMLRQVTLAIAER